MIFGGKAPNRCFTIHELLQFQKRQPRLFARVYSEPRLCIFIFREFDLYYTGFNTFDYVLSGNF